MTHEPLKKVDVVVTHLFHASIDEVWEMWTADPCVQRWWRVNGFSNIIAKMDVREGGSSLVGMRASPEYDGKDYYNVWEYKKVIPLRLIRYISNFADKDGNVITPVEAGLPAETPMNKRQQVEFAEVDGNKTRVTVTELGWLAEGIMAERSRNGLEQTLANIEKALSEPASE